MGCYSISQRQMQGSCDADARITCLVTQAWTLQVSRLADDRQVAAEI